MNKDAPAAVEGHGSQRMSPSVQRHDIPQPPTRSISGAYGTPPVQPQVFHPNTRPSQPAYPRPPPPLDRHTSGSSVPPSQHLTPLRTPSSQTSMSAQYPFPSQYQSPLQSESNRSLDRFPTVTPGGRPPSQLYQHQQASPASFAPPLHPVGLPHSASHSNASATPPSVRHQSPLVHESPLPGGPYPHSSYSHHQHSQPSTPLGPPSVQYSRAPNHGYREAASPYGPHQRTFSGTSAGPAQSIASNSPAPSNAALGHYAESPARYVPPVQLKRQSTDLISNGDRERSTSVSPKTKVYRIPPPPSRSRDGSQDGHSARGSIGTVYQEQHVYRPSPTGRSQSGNMSQGRTSLSHAAPEIQGASFASSPLSDRLDQNQPRRQSQPPHLQHMLSDDGSVLSQTPHPYQTPSDRLPVAEERLTQQPFDPVRSSHASLSDNQEPAQSGKSVSRSTHISQTSVGPTETLLQQPFSNPPLGQDTKITPTPPAKPQHSTPQLQTPAISNNNTMVQKRPAAEDLSTEPVQKKTKNTYAEPPIWARRAPTNPYYNKKSAALPQPTNRMTQQAKRPSPQPASVQPTHQPVPRVNGHAQPTTNGGFQPIRVTDEKNKTAQILGLPWELSITNSAPPNDLVRTVSDFLFINMLSRPNIGVGDPRNGALEIEAKIGQLIDRRTNSRLFLPVDTMTALKAGFSREHIKFESFMNEASRIHSVFSS